MEFTTEKLDNNVVKIIISGRMDHLGTQTIDSKFSEITASQNVNFLVDISKVSFLTSLGMRVLLSTAKAATQKGGLMVLFNARPNVLEVLETSGVASLIPVYQDYAQAMTAFTGR